jgi:hypothetical protein
MNKWLLKANIVVRLSIIMFVILIVEATSTNTESKIESVNENRTINLTTMALKLEEDISNDLYAVKDTYTGDLTGYVADCPLCSGHLSCTPTYNVLNGTETYPDSSYGNVRIVASSKNLPCGTIIRFNKANVSNDPIIAIVLDRGVLGNDIDLLSNNYDYAVSTIGRSSISYDILRTGW